LGKDYSDVQFATKLARNSIRTIVVLFLLFLSIAMAERFIGQSFLARDYEGLAKAEALAGQIKLADERLTNSATNYASASSPTDKRIYLENINVVETAIDEAISLVSPEIAATVGAETRAANESLVKMGRQLIALVDTGRNSEAIRFSKGRDYYTQKRALSKGVDQLLSQLRSEMKEKMWKTNLIAWLISGGVLLLGALVFSFIWRRLNAGMSRSEAAFLAAETQIRDELTTANVMLLRQSKMSQLGQLTATVAHELRNPLGAVRTSAYLMERKLGDRKTEFVGPLSRINAGIVRCDNIITQLLDYSRSSPANKTEVEIDAWIETTLTEQIEHLPQEVKIQCELGLGELKVGMDVERMQRVIINLVSNACEAMVGKGDKLYTRDGGLPILNIMSTKTDRGVEVSVSDNGPGIPDDVLTKIFDPLFTTKSFGTGLGLPAVQKIMEMHSGGLDVKSSVGEGTTFTFWLPSGKSEPLLAVAA
jgi:signal transduction histidine kinase